MQSGVLLSVFVIISFFNIQALKIKLDKLHEQEHIAREVEDGDEDASQEPEPETMSEPGNGTEDSHIEVGELQTKQHGVGGTVYRVDEHTLLLKGFTYDGKGPDAFFYVGAMGTPSTAVGTILPYPFENKFYKYDDQNASIIQGRFDGNQDIRLTTPHSLKTSDIKWLSVWCRAFSIDFGSFYFDHPDSSEDGSQKSVTITNISIADDTVNNHIKVGESHTIQHEVGGTVYKIDDHSLFVEGFTNDGKGPDAFFWAGTEGTPLTSIGTILPYPFKNKFYKYTDKTAPIINGRFSGKENITLKTPPSLKTSDIKWLSVWCRAYSIDFGSFYFNIPDEKDYYYTVAEPESEPELNNDDLTNHIDGTFETSQAKAESEGKPEIQKTSGNKGELESQDAPKSEPILGHGSAGSNQVCLIMRILQFSCVWMILKEY